jgi:hypothetical protein
VYAFVIGCNEKAWARITAPCKLQIVAGASHLVADPGALDAEFRLATASFSRHIAPARASAKRR